MEEVLEQQLFIRSHAFVTFCTIEKVLAGGKKSFRGPHVVQTCSNPIIYSKTLKSSRYVGVVKTSQRSLLDYFLTARKTILVLLTTVKPD